uniref:Conopeptide im020 n=2 Tax=Conus TaxID=6490 RepID=A0A125S9F4_CONIM|nr:conopeptide im020 [Conus imperialis]
MHLSLASSAALMLLLLFALGNFVGVQPGQIRDLNKGQLKDNRRNLQSQRKQMSLLKSLHDRNGCNGNTCSNSPCPNNCYCDTEDDCHPDRREH